MVKKILVPVDGSKNGEKSLRYACRLADKLGASITVLHVVTIPRGREDESIDIERITKRLDAWGQEVLDEAVQIGNEEGCTELIREMRQGIGNPGHEIVKFLQEGDFSLIVMGARGHTLLTHLLLGSVSDVVVHHAPCPVLIVR